MIEARNVSKSFGDTKALIDVSINVEPGTILGLLGPNGAGKTTLVRVLSTLIRPDSGFAKIAGLDVVEHPVAVRKQIGLAGQYAAVDPLLTGRENLELIGRLYRLSATEAKSRATEALQRLTLEDAADKLVKTYSGGMRRRLDLGASLVGRPQVMILDEPTTGLDPRTRLDLWSFLEDLVRDGTTVLLTTQYLEEADRLANQIVVIDRGIVIAEGTTDELKARLGADVIDISFAQNVDFDATIALLAPLSSGKMALEPDESRASIPVQNGSVALVNSVRILDENRIEIKNLNLRRPTLDDVFLSITGKATGLDLAGGPGEPSESMAVKATRSRRNLNGHGDPSAGSR